MLVILSVAIILIVAYFYLQEGLFTAAAMFVSVLLAGLITFNFYEPLAANLGRTFNRTFLKGYEDIICLTFLFAVSLGVLRGIANRLCPDIVEYPGPAQQIGGAVFGLLTGYLVSGFLAVALQTLPWSRNFLDFEPRSKEESETRRYFPADRVWLALMHRAGAGPFGRLDADPEDPNGPPPTFDRDGTFETNHLRLRRYP
jgi:hypothetical protein